MLSHSRCAASREIERAPVAPIAAKRDSNAARTTRAVRARAG